MNSVAMAWPLVPLVKYEPQYARAIGKYMLNAVNASRLFYPDQIDEKNQWLPKLKDLTNGIIGYEGLRKSDDMSNPLLKNSSPVAIGDGPKWAPGQPPECMFSLYSTSIAGVYGAIVNKTGVEGILALNCNATDFYADNKYPVYLYYNPYEETKTVTYLSDNKIDLFDIISKRFLAKGERGNVSMSLRPREAAVVVVLPAGTPLTTDGTKIKAGDAVIAFR